MAKKERGERKKNRQKESRNIRETMSSGLVWIFEILVAVLFAFVLVYFMGQIRTNVGQSMALTLEDSDKVLINTLSYRMGNPSRNDIIAFKPNGSSMAHTNIKRIVGMPGETIEIKEGIIYVNDKVLLEKNDYPLMTNSGLAEKPIKIGINEYFVLGDNRNNSEDSRFADIGLVSGDDIEGKVWFCISPKERVGFVK